jgi:hypothetical protein
MVINLIDNRQQILPEIPLPIDEDTYFAKINNYVTRRREEILESCGNVCNTKTKGLKSNIYKNVDDTSMGIGKLKLGNYRNLKLQTKKFDCSVLLESSVHDLPAPPFMVKPLKTIPKSLNADFTYDGRIKVKPWYFENVFPSNRTTGVSGVKDNVYLDEQWSKEAIERKVAAVRKNYWLFVNGAYGSDETETLYDTLKSHKEALYDKHVLVVGSETPWVESLLLALGTRHVTTLEYNKIKSTHPQVTTIHPNDLISKNNVGTYDAVVSYSSIEHSGLTRYGDAPHPWGDLVTMAKLWCYIKDDGWAFIGIPTSQSDTIYFNAGRYYGPLMLSHLFTNWKLKVASWPFASNDGKQIAFVLQKA